MSLNSTTLPDLDTAPDRVAGLEDELEADQATESTVTEPAADWRGRGKVLVVDDEPVIRTVAQALLDRAGFEVLLATDGLEAVETVRRHGQEILAVLLDLSMPHLDGAQTAREIRRIRPQLKIILCSGYSDLTVDELVTDGTVAGFLHKPYSRDALTGAVRKLVDA